MAQLTNAKRLLLNFLESAKSYNKDVEPIQVLRANAFKIGKANVLVRTASDLGKRYFFGLNYINAEEIYNLSNSFVVFICGCLEQIVFMPTEILIKHLPQISHDRNGEYKINFTRDMKLVLKGRGNHFDCSKFLNNWNLLRESSFVSYKSVNPAESIHTVIQGRLIEIGNIRGFDTYCPNKSKLFNKVKLERLTSIETCPKLQYAEFKSLRNIDVVWFRKISKEFYPEYAFEVEISTGVWSGFGRLATLREYQAKLYIISYDDKRVDQVKKSFPDVSSRYIHLIPDQIALLYSAEKNLIQMRNDFDL